MIKQTKFQYYRQIRPLYLCICLLCTILILSSCNAFNMDYVPTSEQVKKRLPEFILLESVQIEGLYGNHDVDSIIFRYLPKVKPAISINDILISITSNAQRENWQLVDKNINSLHFNRVIPSGNFFSIEDVRVIVVEKNLKVYISWVQADSTKEVSSFEKTGESSFAKRVIWPKLESYIAQEESLSDK